MKSDYDVIRSKSKTISNAESIAIDQENTTKGIAAPPIQLKVNSSSKYKKSGNSSSSKTKMPYQLKKKMEGSFGRDFSNVDVYKNSSYAQSMNAKAFTQGNEIHFAPGEYAPHSQSGQELIGHELTHVGQQRDSNIPVTQQYQGNAINADPKLEQEAEKKGTKAASGESVNEKNNPETKQTVLKPVTQGFFGNPMKGLYKGLHKVFKSSIESTNEDKKHWLKKGKQALKFGKNIASNVVGAVTKIPGLVSLVNKGVNAIKSILQDPIAFLKNIFGAIKGGFLQFFGNITKHLTNGLVSWLMNAMGSAGITIPKSLSLKAVMAMVQQVIMLTWSKVKEKLIKIIGKKAMEFGGNVYKFLMKIIDVGPRALLKAIKKLVLKIMKNSFNFIGNLKSHLS